MDQSFLFVCMWLRLEVVRGTGSRHLWVYSGELRPTLRAGVRQLTAVGWELRRAKVQYDR